MEVRPGYKQTEVGVIPGDWLNPQLQHITDDGSPICYGIVQVGPFTPNGVPVLAIKNLNLDYSSNIHRASIAVERLYVRSRVRPGDIVVSVKGTTGRVGIVPSHFRGNISRDLARIRPRAGVAPRFVYQMLQSGLVQRRLANAAVGTTRMELSIATLKEVCVPLPASQAEQQAIAEVLSDVDALIESLEQLLAKKRQIKQGAMQELLTGKKRLPGFNSSWEVVNLDGVVDRITGVWGANDPSPEHPRCTDIIRAGDISQDGRLTGCARRFLSDSELSRAHCRLDDIVITTSGNGLGKVWWCDGRPNLAVSNFVRILRPLTSRSQGRYLSYVLRSEAGLKQLQEHTATSAYPNLRPSFFGTAWISLPPIPEQAAVADILSDMDLEIAALAAKLTKARSIKQGMMQELLTGRIRLV